MRTAWMIIKTLLIIALADSCFGDGPKLAEVLSDPRAIWYSDNPDDPNYLPECYVEVGSLIPLDYNTATFPGQEDATGSANNEKPWRHTGGLDDCGPEVEVYRLLWLPPGEKIRIRRERREVIRPSIRGPAYTRVQGTYPVGTVSAELLFDSDRLFEIRSRRKGGNGWETDQFEWGKKPRGYKSVDNCVDCHADIGKHSLMLDSRRDWYGVVRGIEPGGPIHFHVFEYDDNGPVRQPIRIRDDVKSLVEWEK